MGSIRLNGLRVLDGRQREGEGAASVWEGECVGRGLANPVGWVKGGACQ